MRLSPAAFGAALLCFFLPFLTVTCQGQEVATLTGVQLVTGTDIQQQTPLGPSQKQHVDNEPLALVAVLCAVAGAGIGFLRDRRAGIASAVAGIAGAVSLWMMKSKFEERILSQGNRALAVEFGNGFYLALVFLLVGAALGAYAFWQFRGWEASPATSAAST